MHALVALSLLTAVWAGSHGVGEERLHARHFPANKGTLTERVNSTLPVKFKRDCQLGAWKCVGDELQRCDHNTWVSVQHCTGENIVCSADSRATGCIWSWSLGDPNKSPVTAVGLPPLSSPATGTATNGPPATSVASPSVPTPPTPATNPSTPAGPSTAAVQTGTMIGGNLIAGGKDASGGNPPPENQDTPGPNTNTWKNAGLAPSVNPTAAQSSVQPTGVTSASPAPPPNGSTATSASTPTAGGNHAPPSQKWTAPHYVIYSDDPFPDKVSLPAASAISNYNRFILAFWMAIDMGAHDNAKVWEMQTDAYRQKVLDEYHAAGIALMVTAFGWTDAPTNADPVATAQKLAAWVKQYGVDGVDVDYEDLDAMTTGKAETWLISFHKELRSQLPEPYIISHAPVGPWFSSGSTYPSGAYVKVHKEVGDTISWYNIQYYNQGTAAYMDCESLVSDSRNSFPDTSVMQIHSHAGVPLDKLVIGKPIKVASAPSGGYMDPALLASCVGQAKSQGWNGGVMLWQWFPDIGNAVMGTIRG